MLPRYEDILHLLAYNGYENEAYFGSFACKETWSDARIIAPYVLDMRFGQNMSTIIGIYSKKILSNTNRERLSYLLNLGGDPNISDTNGYTPLIWSCIFYGYSGFELTKLLLENGADVNKSDTFETPLAISARFDDFERTQLLLENGADPNSVVSSSSVLDRVCKHHLSEGRSTRCIELLLKNGANPNFIDETGRSIIETCIIRRYIKIASMLVEHGATFPTGNLCMTNVINNNNATGIKFMLKHGYTIPKGALIHKIEIGDLEGIRILLQYRANPNTPLISGDGSTYPLSVALKNINENTLSIVKMLIDAGVDLNIDVVFGPSPLKRLFEDYITTYNENTFKLIEILLEKGATPPTLVEYNQILKYHEKEMYDFFRLNRLLLKQKNR